MVSLLLLLVVFNSSSSKRLISTSLPFFFLTEKWRKNCKCFLVQGPDNGLTYIYTYI